MHNRSLKRNSVPNQNRQEQFSGVINIFVSSSSKTCLRYRKLNYKCLDSTTLMFFQFRKLKKYSNLPIKCSSGFAIQSQCVMLALACRLMLQLQLLQRSTFLNIKLLYGCFSRLLNCRNSTKSHRASLMHSMQRSVQGP